MEITEEQLFTQMKHQAFATAKEVATVCIAICEANRGHLSVGDLIKQKLSLSGLDLENNTIVSKNDTKKKSHLTLVKK